MNAAVIGPSNKDLTVFLDGTFIKFSEAVFYANNQALNYGTGTFEGIRAYANAGHNQLNLFRVREHYDRLLASAAILKIVIPYSSDELVAITKELLIKNALREDVYIRPLVLKKALLPGQKFGVKLSGISATICINAMPMGSYAKTSGLRCTVSSWQRISNAAIPSSAKITGTYVNSALAYDEAQENGFDDAILFNEHQQCAEATTSNVFIVKDGKVSTPPLSAGLLNGITRRSVIDICETHAIPCAERNITKEMLYGADECFLTGTGLELATVSVMDGVHYPAQDESIAEFISTEYQRIVRGEHDKFSSWLTPVY
ncbi:MAG: branched-chain amino acid transaminase [Pseudomonadota bacterium]